MELKGKVDLPGVGEVDRRVLLGVGGVAAAFLGWKYYQSRSAAAYDPEAAPVEPGMEDAGVLPSVSGAVSGDNSYGLPAGDGSNSGSSTDSYGFKGTSNSQWTQYAANQLSQGSDSWSYAAIVGALGKFVANRALTSGEQEIVQAAIAVAGYPPEGSHVIIPGGDVPVTVAPTGLKVTKTGNDYVNLSWSPVAGARDYRVYRSGAGSSAQAAGAGSTTVYGLQPNQSYSFQVAAVSMGGSVGPKSAGVTGKTTAVALKAPTGVKITSVTGSQATVSWTKVPGATSYKVYVNGQLKASPDGTASSSRISGLAKKTKYTVTVRADTANQPDGPASSGASFTTKSK
ncbi:fibronectin type III domain-containing protein [Streptomyces sp. B21-108]|uniref:fibronectin type III domain-containing protein n=1 Tax=Streptomyces sp. B21-108 TaxID=3039419 RepID=UPI002FF0CF51